MFYLKYFFKILFDHFVVGTAFIILTSTLIISSGMTKKISKYFDMTSKEKMAGSYFHALISSKKNVERTARRIRKLPGIQSVMVTDTSNIKKAVTNITKNLDISLPSGVLDEDFQSIKVEFTPKLQERSRNLIREYLTRLINKDNIFIGPIIHPKKRINTNKDSFFSKHMIEVILGIISILLIITQFAFVKKIRSTAYFVEQFQRRRLVGLKISYTGTFLICALSATPLLMLPSTSWPNIAMIFALLIITSTVMNLSNSEWNQ